MTEFDFYQHIFFVINRRLDYLLGSDTKTPPVLFTSYNPYDRCINNYRIKYKWEKCLKFAPNIIETFNADDTQKSLERFFSCFEGDRIHEQSINTLKAELKLENPNYNEFLYHLIVLYHHFPRHPDLFIDGKVKNLLLKIAGKCTVPFYGTIDVVGKEPKLGYNFYPWLKITLYDEKGKNLRFYADQKHDWLLIDQERSGEKRILKDYPTKCIEPSLEVKQYLHHCRLIHEYLDPLFIGFKTNEGKAFQGKGFFTNSQIGIENLDVAHFLLVPVYDFENESIIQGNLSGNFLIPFQEETDRTEFIEQYHKSIRAKVAPIAKDIRNARTEYILSGEIWDLKDPLNDFICKLPYIQDWECIVLFNRKTNNIERCYPRPQIAGLETCNYPVNDSNYPANYKQPAEECNKKNKHCSDCALFFVASQIKANLPHNHDTGVFGIEAGPHQKTLFYYADLKCLLTTKVLSFIDSHLIDRYQDLVICFQFPSYTLFGAKIPEETGPKAKQLGDLYLNELLPVFDKILLKLKVGDTAYTEGYDTGDKKSRHDMSVFLYRVLRHDMKNLYDDVVYALAQVRDEFQNRSKYLELQKFLISTLNLHMISTELDDIWRIDDSVRIEKISLRKLKHKLDNCWQKPWMRACQFEGEWDKELQVPKLSKIVLGNLLENAITYGEGDSVITRCNLKNNTVIFEILSQKNFSESNREKFIERKLTHDIPKKHRGLWLCRYILERRLNGRLQIGPGAKNLKTNFQAIFPLTGG